MLKVWGLRKLSLTKCPEQILEVGGGVGVFAKAFVEYLHEQYKEMDFKYTICDISPQLLKNQQQFCIDYAESMNFVQGRGEQMPFPSETFDWVISNEVIADFVSVKPGHYEEKYAAEFQRMVKIYNISNSTQDTYINLGAILFLEEIKRVLKPGGIAIISEYEEENSVPAISRYMSDHKEVAIDFTLLSKVAKQLNFKCHVIDLSAFLEVNENIKILHPNYFAPLKTLLAKYDIHLKKLIYDETYIKQVEEAYEISNLQYSSVASLIRFFKVLILQK